MTDATWLMSADWTKVSWHAPVAERWRVPRVVWPSCSTCLGPRMVPKLPDQLPDLRHGPVRLDELNALVSQPNGFSVCKTNCCFQVRDDQAEVPTVPRELAKAAADGHGDMARPAPGVMHSDLSAAG